MLISKLASLSRWILILAAIIFASSAVSFAQEKTSEEINLEVFRRVFREGFEERNPEVFRELFAPEFIAHTPDSENTVEIAVATVSSIVTAMPDVTLTEEVVFASGDYVFGRLLFEATFTNPLVTPMGEIPPTGQPVRYIIDSVHRYNEDHLLVEEWLLWDNLSLFAQLGAMPAPAAAEGGISQEAAQAFAERFDAIFDGGNIDIADEIFSPEFVAHLPLAPQLDRDGWKAYAASFYDAFPDLTQEVNQVIVGKDRVILLVTYTGTHDGALFGIPPTGNSVTMGGVGIFSFDENGLATENWAVLDVVGVLAQIGAFPPAPAE